MGAIPSLSWNVIAPYCREFGAHQHDVCPVAADWLRRQATMIMMTTAATVRACIEIEWNHGSKAKASSIDAQTSQR
jgi:hypothetical protein